MACSRGLAVGPSIHFRTAARGTWWLTVGSDTSASSTAEGVNAAAAHDSR